MEPFESYSLLIMDSRRILMNFNSLDTLKYELSQYLSPSEISRGILHRLTDFTGKKANENGYVKNKWRNFSVCAYPYED